MHSILFTQASDNSLLYVRKNNGINTTDGQIFSQKNAEIILVSNGSGSIKTTDDVISIKKKDIIIVNKSIMHVEFGDDLSTISIGVGSISFYFPNSEIQKMVKFQLDDKSFRFLLFQFETIYSESKTNLEYSGGIINSCYQNIEYMLKRKTDTIIYNKKESEYSDLVQNIKNHLDSLSYQNLKLDELASMFSLSKSSICHKFKQEIGMSVMEYRIERQILKSKELIALTDMRMSEIALMTGFNSMSYFSKCFKKYIGVSPKEYKEQFR